MPRNRVQLAWLPLLVIGCGKPTSEAVHVDLESLCTAPRPGLASSRTPPPPMAGNRTTLPGLPATTLRAQGDRELAEMRKLIEADRDRALTALTRRLARLYAEQAKRREDEIMGPLRDLIESATKEAYAAVSLALQEYADQRGPLLPRFYLLIDGTDYHKLVPKPKIESPLATQRYEEADKIRTQLLELDRLFRARIQELLAAAEARIQREETRLRAQFAELLLNAQDRAAADAKGRLSTRRQDLDDSAVGDVKINLPAQPAKSVETPASEPLPVPPVVKRVGLGESAADQRATLSTDLKIWLATSGYRLDAKGRDATQEFKTWRTQRKAGP